jgi:RNA polymerase sigma-70 factor (ECF subfamily)
MGAGERQDDILGMNAQFLFEYFRFMPMQNFDERQALSGLRQLDAQAIGAIFDKYFAEIYRYVRYRLNDEHLAEDIASDVFVRMLEAAQRGRGPQSNLRAWLISTASHIVTDHLRRSYAMPVGALPEDLLDPASAPSDEFDRREQTRSFREAYVQLTFEQQHVLALRFGEGYSLEETASALRKNVNAVKALQFRALAALQRNIGDVADE